MTVTVFRRDTKQTFSFVEWDRQTAINRAIEVLGWNAFTSVVKRQQTPNGLRLSLSPYHRGLPFAEITIS
jgi:hypothetical protein